MGRKILNWLNRATFWGIFVNRGLIRDVNYNYGWILNNHQNVTRNISS
jgi:hypothetical protein